MSERVMVIGSGAREHALCHHIARHGHTVVCAPGNAGIGRDVECVETASDVEALVRTVLAQEPSLVVVGPEAPLCDGLVDALEERGVAAFGPKKAAAQLEGSKAFMKAICDEAGVPTARYAVCDTLDAAQEAVAAFSDDERVVLKADGLAGGKGVFIEADPGSARARVEALYRDETPRLVIESFLDGEELSVLGICDGERVQLLPVARDHKQLYDGGRGPNTGGMGAVAPLGPGDGIDADFLARVEREVFTPVLKTMTTRRAPYRGLLYAGLMYARERDALDVLEFNCRFGDPEAQVVLFGLDDDLTGLMKTVATGGALSPKTLSMKDTATVVVASEGYPGPAVTGRELGLPDVGPDEKIFCAGVNAKEGTLLSAGGRVVSCTARRDTLGAAIAAAYRLADAVTLEGKHIRRDIGKSVAGASKKS